MKKIMLIVLLLMSPCAAEDAHVALSKELYKAQPTPLLVIVPENNTVNKVVDHFIKCFNISGRFKIEKKICEAALTRQVLKSYFDQGYSLLLSFTLVPEKNALEWRLYDTIEGSMLKGKRYWAQKGQNNILLARTCAHHVWNVLTGSESSFLSTLLFTVKKKKKQSWTTAFYCADYDGGHQRLWKNFPTICVNPHWYPHKEKPFVVYSEFTPYNVRLMACDMNNKIFKICDGEGTFGGVSWSSDKQEMVYSRSGKIWTCIYNPTQKKWKHSCIIEEKEACASPCLIDEGIVYCGGGKIKFYHRKRNTTEILTPEGYCVAPLYSSLKRKIVYSKRIHGTMQLCMYDLRTKKHTQLTFTAGHKTDPCWSPCGTFIAYCHNEGKLMQIAILNCLTGNIEIITSSDQCCGYPSWSPAFDFYLSL